ncbi:hypothetical protein LDENG_00185680 [Lucifuga dentata]|nr:hypothetical protein LDENG_00185680 [Lucifuga dentata]
MAELEIDQSHLPRVQEVCKCFAVLEDGVFAHSLQEQEIEHYYTTNIQKNQIVQNDIRMAKRLQDEEEEQRAKQRAFLRQTSRQLEEQDFQYACVIQEEIQRCAEEVQRREQDDEEMAKQMQEEEEERVRRRTRGQEGYCEDSTSGPAVPHQHTLSSLHQGERQHSSTTTRWQCSTLQTHTDLPGSQPESPRGVTALKHTTPWSNEGHTHSIRQIRDEVREPLSEDSEDSDAVFSEQLSAWSQRLYKTVSTASPWHWASFRKPKEINYRGHRSQSSFREGLRSCEEERGERNEDCYEYGDPDKRLARKRVEERNHRDEYQHLHRHRHHDLDFRPTEARERRCSRSESVRLQDRNRHGSRDLARTWTYRDNPDKHVRFQEDTRSCNGHQNGSNRVWEMLGQILRERGVPVRLGAPGVPLQVGPQSRDSQVLHGSEVSHGDSQPHQRVFQRAAFTRHSFHGDIRERRRLSHRQNSERDHRVDRDKPRNFSCNVEDGGEVYEMQRRDSHLADRERRGSRGSSGYRYNDDTGETNPDKHHDCRVTRTTSQRWHWHKKSEEKLSLEEGEVERRAAWPNRSVSQHSQSFRYSGAPARNRSRPTSAGASLQPEPERTCLDMGELQQVLEDEELARRLQEEEEKLLRRSSQPSPRTSYPEGDFRVAQVAQDEEIARFMQKQEIKSKRRSRELEGPASWREHRAMISHHDRRAARETEVQRERLDSEGLPSPTEDCSPENLPPSPISTLPQTQHIRNVAEELDPTFQARRHDTDSLPVGQTGPACQSLPNSNSGLHDFLEEPAFIPPTKRQSDKSANSKPKVKKENCKQQ